MDKKLPSAIGAKPTSGDASFYDFPIGQSLRFDGSSYLSWTSNNSSTDHDKYTISMWIKKTKAASNETYLSAGAVSSTSYGTYFGTDFHLGSKLSFTSHHGNTTPWFVSSAGVQRDTAAWYHYVVVMDQDNSTLSSRIKIYINGVLDSLTVGGYPASNHASEINEPSTIHNIGRRSGLSDTHCSSYMANIQFIDGQALDPYFFGESKNGVWIPYNAFSTAGSGTATASDGDTATDSYGTNGFRLTFDAIDTSSGNRFLDKSGNTNHWTIH